MAETGVRTLRFSLKRNTNVPGTIEIRLHELYTFMRFLSVITQIRCERERKESWFSRIK